MTTKEHRNELQRIRRKKSGNSKEKKYEKTPKGYLVRQYRNMLSRVRGINKRAAHLYFGLDIMTKEEFYHWALYDPEFLRLYDDYKNSGWQVELAPSVDRVDSTKGYTLDNVRYLTFEDNRLRGLSTNHPQPEVQEAEPVIEAPF